MNETGKNLYLSKKAWSWQSKLGPFEWLIELASLHPPCHFLMSDQAFIHCPGRQQLQAACHFL